MPCPTSNDKLKRQATAQPTALQEADREGQPVAAQQPVGAFDDFDGDVR